MKIPFARIVPLLLLFFVWFAAVVRLSASVAVPPVAAGPGWIDTGIEVPFQHAAGPLLATTGKGSLPIEARLDRPAGEWTITGIQNVTSITQVQETDNGYILIAEDQRVMVWRPGVAPGHWLESYVLGNPSEKFLINQGGWDIITDDGILVSTDRGVSWQKHPTPGWRARAIISETGRGSHDGRALVVGDDGEVFVSQSRIHWSRLDIGTDEDLVAVGAVFSGFVVITASGRVFSTDARTTEWTDHGKRLPPGISKISGDSPLLAVAEDGRLFTSADGVHWSERLLPDGAEAVSAGDRYRQRPLIVTSTGRLLQADHMIPYPIIYASQDGIGGWDMGVIYATNPFEWLHDGQPTGVTAYSHTATQSGEFRVMMSRPDGTELLTDAAVVVVKETFETWRENHFSETELADPEISGIHADPDGKGWPNLLRFAVHRDGENVGPVQSLLATGSEGESLVAMTYLRPKAAGEIGYVEEYSSDLRTWWTLPSTAIRRMEDLGDTERVTVQVPEPETGQTFFRLRVYLH